jgi:hypothetical protein
MNQKALQVFFGFAIVVGLTAALLIRVRANYVLGEPGVKLADVPVYNEEGQLISGQSVHLPERVGEYTSTNLPVMNMELAMLPGDTLFGRRHYVSSSGPQLLVSVVLMGTDRTSIHKPEYCLQGQGQSIVSSDVITIPMSKPHPYELKVMKLTTQGLRYVGNRKSIPVSGLYLYWFVADGHLTPFHGERMWLMGRDLVTRGLLQRWAYISCFGQCSPGEEGKLLEQMKEFIVASIPEVQSTPEQRAFAQH